MRYYRAKRYSARIANAYYDCLFGNTEHAIQLLEKVKQLILNSYKIRARILYLLGSIILLFICVIILFTYKYSGLFNIEKNLLLYMTIATFGSFGGFLSISFNFAKLILDFEESTFIPFLTGLSRISISIVSSLIVFSIIRSNIVLGVFNEIHNDYVYFSLAALSGFSETFVPNILKTIETDNKQ